jgi:prevent-host-death family protein
MTTKRMKSNEVRINWRDVLDEVRSGGRIVVEHYNRPVAVITPYRESIMIMTLEEAQDLVTRINEAVRACPDYDNAREPQFVDNYTRLQYETACEVVGIVPLTDDEIEAAGHPTDFGSHHPRTIPFVADLLADRRLYGIET